MLNEVISNLNATQAVGLFILLSAYFVSWAAVLLHVTAKEGNGKLWEYIYLASPLGISLALLIFG